MKNMNKIFKKIIIMTFISLLMNSCSSEEETIQLDSPPFTTNGYKVNENYHNTNYSFSSGQSGITDPFILSFFSHEPPFENKVVYYNSFQLKESNIVIGEHEIKANTIQYKRESNDPDNPIIVNGDNTFIDGKAIVYDAKFDNSGELIHIEIAYWINWEATSIQGYYSGKVT
jgi:hypothetical protein